MLEQGSKLSTLWNMLNFDFLTCSSNFITAEHILIFTEYVEFVCTFRADFFAYSVNSRPFVSKWWILYIPHVSYTKIYAFPTQISTGNLGYAGASFFSFFRFFQIGKNEKTKKIFIFFVFSFFPIWKKRKNEKKFHFFRFFVFSFFPAEKNGP